MIIYLGADHAGFKLKEKIKSYLSNQRIKYQDLGNTKFDPQDDYPDIAQKVARKVAKTASRGILICGSGVGVCVAANKVKGVRAVRTSDPEIARTAREDDDTNILCLPGRYVDFEKAKRVVKVWLKAKFSQAPRHCRRLEKIEKINP